MKKKKKKKKKKNETLSSNCLQKWNHHFSSSLPFSGLGLLPSLVEKSTSAQMIRLDFTNIIKTPLPK